MRIKTIPSIVAEIKTLDSLSAAGASFLTALAEAKQLPHTYHGNRLVAEKALAPTLNRLFGFGGDGGIPNIRTIRGTVAELKQSRSAMGIGEKLIRSAVKDGRIPCIRIGNREYIAMQSFDEPYCRRIFEPSATSPISRAEAVRCL